jgi:ABC-type sugar transport system ATPase subunit
VPEMSVAENLFLGDMPTRGPLVDQRETRERARRLLARAGLDDLSTGAPVGSLRLGVRQLLEVAKLCTRMYGSWFWTSRRARCRAPR